MHISRIKSLIQDVKKPILEIAGPTPEGYEIINSLNIKLPYEPIISNISENVVVNSYGERTKNYKVDRVIDIKQPPKIKEHYGMILCSNLPLDPGQSLFATYEARQEYWVKMKSKVLEEYIAAIDQKDEEIKFTLNLHIALFIFSKNSLTDGGILIFQGIMHQDNEIAIRLGFNKLLSLHSEKKYSTQVYLLPNAE